MFFENHCSLRNQNAKIIELFEELGLLNNRGVTFWAEKIGPVIVRIWHQLLHMALWAPLALAEYLLFILSAASRFLESK